MSIVRIGLGETKGYHDGYDAIFKKKPAKAAAPAAKKAAPPAKKPAAKPAKKK
jgi:hypothetical protein